MGNDNTSITRRDFVKQTAAAATAAMIVPRHVLGRGFQAPSDLVNIATVGVTGMGASNTRAVMSQNIVALCDVDFDLLDTRLEAWSRPPRPPQPRPAGPPPPPSPWKDYGPSKAQLAADARWPAIDQDATLRRFVEQQLPRVKKYRDYREMLEKQKDIDGIIVATPDHMHAVIASNAMSLGKHVYVQKPLCWSVHEARHLAKKAIDTKVVTQMGNQRHSADNSRRGIEYIQSGALGEIREVHVWTNRPLGFWPQGVPRPAPITGDPAQLRWDNRGVMQRLSAAMLGAKRRLQGARQAVVGSVPWCRAERRLPPALSPLQLARLGRLGPGRARRHGRAPDGLPGVVTQPGPADGDRNRSDAVQRRLLSKCDDDVLRVPGAEGHAAGEVDLVRRRADAARSRRARERDARSERRRPLRRQESQAAPL